MRDDTYKKYMNTFISLFGKSIFILGIVFCVFQLSAAEAVSNRRDVLAYWKNGIVEILGHHRPYSTIMAFEDEEELAKTTADAKGEFIFTISLPPGEEHTVRISAKDHLGRDILNEDGELDVLYARVLPNLKIEGQVRAEDGTPIVGAQIDMRDNEKKLLNRFYTDQNGFYYINSIPKGASFTVSGEGFLGEEVDYSGNQNIDIVLETDPALGPPKTVAEVEEEMEQEEVKIHLEEKSEENSIYAWLYWVMIIAISGGVLLFLWQKWQERKNGGV